MCSDVSDLEWIGKWFAKHCDGDWEHENIFRISSTSNPGWSVTVDLSETPLAAHQFDSGLIKKSEEDYYWIKVADCKFDAFGDVGKLAFLIRSFREILISKGDEIDK